MRLHYAEGLSDPQAERTSHTPGDMAAQGPEATRHRTPCLPGTLVDAQARLEGCLLQNLQFPLGGVVGRLERLRLRRRRPESGPQA
jgi:hypothetical protein